MPYKCLECGHVFEDGEQAKWIESYGFIDGTGEKFEGCPNCNGSFAETRQCDNCKHEFLEDELYSGLCAECLREAVTFNEFLAYLIATNNLKLFMFEKVWEMNEPTGVSKQMCEIMTNCYASKTINDAENFMKLCEAFVMDDDGEFGRNDYAEWLKTKEVK